MHLVKMLINEIKKYLKILSIRKQIRSEIKNEYDEYIKTMDTEIKIFSMDKYIIAFVLSAFNAEFPYSTFKIKIYHPDGKIEISSYNLKN